MSLENRIDGLEGALLRIERRARVWRGISAALGGVLVLLVATGAAQKASIVSAKEFRLEDEAGKLRGCLTLRADGTPGLALFDESSHLRLSLDLARDGAPGVNLHYAAGHL